MIARTPSWPIVLRRYLAASLFLHLAWEVLQLPLYTIWSDPLGKRAFAVFHCTIGDLMIAGLSLLVALAFASKAEWPQSSLQPVWLLMLTFGIGYTIYSEWLNVSVRGAWAYSSLMPTLPLVGIGLGPLLQWLIVPTTAMRIATGHVPWTAKQAQS